MKTEDNQEIRDLYDEIVLSYTIQVSDTDPEKLAKLLQNSEIDLASKNAYICGLKELVSELRSKIDMLEKEFHLK